MKKIIARTFLLIFVISTAYIGIRFLLNSNFKKNELDQFPTLKFIFNENQKKKNPIAKIVDDNLVGSAGNYAIVIKSLKNNEEFSLNEHELFKTGSLYKLWVMAAIFDEIKKGNVKEDEILSADIDSLNSKFEISPDVAELKEGVITLSVKDALYQMITISHNYAAYLLTDKIKVSGIRNFLKTYEFGESSLDDDLPTVSASDISEFLEKAYKGEIVDKDSSERMLLLLKQQKLNNKLPSGLPENTIIAHKTGELDDFTHDVGIVYTPKGDYVIVVLSESDNPSAAEDRISSISKDIYEYFTK